MVHVLDMIAIYVSLNHEMEMDSILQIEISQERSFSCILDGKNFFRVGGYPSFQIIYEPSSFKN